MKPYRRVLDEDDGDRSAANGRDRTEHVVRVEEKLTDAIQERGNPEDSGHPDDERLPLSFELIEADECPKMNDNETDDRLTEGE